jgi:hypothetical protein
LTSPKRLAANRQNARKSTGPRTPAGKARVATNAVQHGVFAKLPLLAALGESAEDWHAFRGGVVADLAPVGPLELALAERAAATLWRLARAARADAAAAAVAFLPAASLPAPPPGLADCDAWATHCTELRDRAAAARAAAASFDRLAGVLGRLSAADGHEPVPAGDAAALWRAAVCAAGRLPGRDGPRLAGEALAAEGLSGPDLAEALAFRGWTAARLRAGLARLAALRADGDVAALAAAAADELRREAAGRARDAEACDAFVHRLEGERAADRVRAALGPAGSACGWLDLVSRYERSLGRELERVLRLLGGVRAGRPARAAGPAG